MEPTSEGSRPGHLKRLGFGLLVYTPETHNPTLGTAVPVGVKRGRGGEDG